jgi:hypothetical protein
LVKVLPLAGFEGLIRPEVAGSTSFKETGKLARIDTRREWDISVESGEAMKAFSAQVTEFY